MQGTEHDAICPVCAEPTRALADERCQRCVDEQADAFWAAWEANPENDPDGRVVSG